MNSGNGNNSNQPDYYMQMNELMTKLDFYQEKKNWKGYCTVGCQLFDLYNEIGIIEKFDELQKTINGNLAKKGRWAEYYRFKYYSKTHHPKFQFGAWMANWVVRKWENNMMAFVYAGAAFLVVLIGVRALGTGFFDLPDIVVFIGLLLEFAMILILGVFTFFKPEDGHIATSDEKTINKQFSNGNNDFCFENNIENFGKAVSSINDIKQLNELMEIIFSRLEELKIKDVSTYCRMMDMIVENADYDQMIENLTLKHIKKLKELCKKVP